MSAKIVALERGSAAVESAVERLVREHRWLLRAVALKLQHKLGVHLAVDDLVSLGAPGLLDAARTHDPRQATFPAYAAKKVKWAILDGVRRETHGRSALARARALAASDRLGEAYAELPPAQPEEEAYQRRVRTLLEGHAAALVIGLTVPAEAPDDLLDPGDDPEAVALRRSRMRSLRRVVATLPEPQRSLIEQHYFEDRPFAEIAVDLGLSRTQASRAHARAIEALGAALLADGG